jgi:cell division protein FtsI (penicillin-binding protein 3)
VITIAGKTGTAQIQQGGSVIGHNVAFCGYFPYEKPLYTCIVTITRPRNGLPSGGTMCGTVVKEIAEKIYAGCTVVDVADMPRDSARVSKAKVLNGDFKTVNKLKGDLVPNVVGMGAIDAVYAMEKCGLRVSLTGHGSVVKQSISGGSKAATGQTVSLTLN